MDSPDDSDSPDVVFDVSDVVFDVIDVSGVVFDVFERRFRRFGL